MRRPVLSLALLVLAVAAPSAAADGAGFTDPCGDATGLLRVNDTRVDLPTPNAPRYDLREAGLANLPGGGLRATLGLCGDVGAAPDGLDAMRQVSATYAPDCSLAIVLQEGAAPGVARTARLQGSCTRTKPDVLGGTTTEQAPQFDVALPASAVTIAGADIAIDVPREGLAGAAAAALASGTTLTGVRAVTSSGLQSWGGGSSGDGLSFSHKTPGALDFAGGDAALTVG